MTAEDTLQASLVRLNELLPLKARQDRLTAKLKDLHRAVITSLVMQGRPPSRAEVADLVGESHVDDALAQLKKDDLIVLSSDRQNILGAYPVTSEHTPHVVEVRGHSIYAMCSVDALAVSALHDSRVKIRSSCPVTKEPVVVLQDNGKIIEATPSTTVIGVHWQPPSDNCAAHSMCRDMVFLKDAAAATKWQAGDLKNHSIFTLQEAVAFGAAFFGPLM